MRYLLDTNVVVAMLRDPASRPALRARQERVGDVAISTIVAHELLYGAFKSRRATHNVALVDALQLPVVELDRTHARQAGARRAFLAGRRVTFGPFAIRIGCRGLVPGLLL